jgi:hypothetical protein
LLKIADFFSVKIKEAKKRILIFVFLNYIIKLVISVGIKKKILQKADLVIFIEKKKPILKTKSLK